MNIARANNSHIIGYVQPRFIKCAHCSDRGGIVCRKNRRRHIAFLYPSLHSFISVAFSKSAVTNSLLVHGNFVVLQSFTITFESVESRRRLRAAKMTDFAMTETY